MGVEFLVEFFVEFCEFIVLVFGGLVLCYFGVQLNFGYDCGCEVLQGSDLCFILVLNDKVYDVERIDDVFFWRDQGKVEIGDDVLFIDCWVVFEDQMFVCVFDDQWLVGEMVVLID